MIPLIELAPGYSIPRVILGAWQLSLGHSDLAGDRDTIFSTWDRALDHGLNTFDCADIYTGVEALIGRYIRGRITAGVAPPQVHTKFVPDAAALPTIDRRYVAQIIDRSLTRLGVEQLDLVQFHWWDYSVAGYRDTVGWLCDLVRVGKIRAIGLTNFDTAKTRELASLGDPIVATQVQYSMLDQRPARGLDQVADGNRIGLLCYGTVAGGFLSERWLGAPAPADLENRSLVKYLLVIDDFGGWERFQGLLATLDRIARTHGCTIPAVALRWVIDRRAVAAAIVGTRRDGHFDSIEAAFRLHLSAADRQAIALATGPDPGPAGDVYTAERCQGKHSAIMRYDLNNRASD